MHKCNASWTHVSNGVKYFFERDLLDLLVVGVNDALRLVDWLTAGGGGGMVGGVDWVFTSAGESGIVPTFCTLLPATRRKRRRGEKADGHWDAAPEWGGGRKETKTTFKAGDSCLKRGSADIFTWVPSIVSLNPTPRKKNKPKQTNQCGEWK